MTCPHVGGSLRARADCRGAHQACSLSHLCGDSGAPWLKCMGHGCLQLCLGMTVCCMMPCGILCSKSSIRVLEVSRCLLCADACCFEVASDKAHRFTGCACHLSWRYLCLHRLWKTDMRPGRLVCEVCSRIPHDFCHLPSWQT